MSNGDVHLCQLLDGGTVSALRAEGYEYGTCFPKWAENNRSSVLNLLKSYIYAGSNIILTPTFAANPIRLAIDGITKRSGELNGFLAGMALQAVKESQKEVLIAGDIGPTGKLVDPFCDISFEDKIRSYDIQVQTLNTFVDMFFIETMSAMSDMRAAFFACRKTGKPIFVCVTVDDDSETDEIGVPAISAAITLQALGANAFGFNCSTHENTILALKKVAPYVKIPLIAKPRYVNIDDNGNEEYIPREDAHRYNKELLSLGVSYIGGCCGSTIDDITDMRELLNSEYEVNVADKKYDTSFVFSCDNQIFCLQPDTTEISEPINCLPDMEVTIAEACHQSVDVLRVAVNSIDDALDFSRNAHMSTLPVMFLSENETALEKALLLYQGRALVDSTSTIPPERLRQIAAKYGAVVY